MSHHISPLLLDKTCQIKTDKNMATSQVNQHDCRVRQYSIMCLSYRRACLSDVSAALLMIVSEHNSDASQKTQHGEALSRPAGCFCGRGGLLF